MDPLLSFSRQRENEALAHLEAKVLREFSLFVALRARSTGGEHRDRRDLARGADVVNIVKVIISVHGSDALKVFWNEWTKDKTADTTTYRNTYKTTYKISRHTVEGCAEEIRNVLLELVKHCLKKDIEAAAPILKKLAEKGNLLYQALFTKFGDEGEEDPHEIRDHLATLEDPFQLDFLVSNLVLVPWGLIYPADPDLLPASWEGTRNSERWRNIVIFGASLTMRPRDTIVKRKSRTHRRSPCFGSSIRPCLRRPGTISSPHRRRTLSIGWMPATAF